MNSVARTLVTHLDRLVHEWSVEVEKASSARGLSPPECAGVMRAYLLALTRRSDSGRDDLGSGVREADAHIALRLRQGFDLADIVEEFAAMGRAVSKLWAEMPAEARPDPIAMGAFHAELHRASVRAPQVFEEHMFEDEQRDKRYQRRLEALADRKLLDPSPASGERLGGELTVLVDALAAAGAALVARAKTQGIVLDVVGSDPRVVEALRAHASAVDFFEGEQTPTIASTVLPATEPLLVVDVHQALVTWLPSSDARSLALIVVRRGEAHDFTPRDIQRMELLGERFAWHLDRARLHGDLKRTIAALRTEQLLRERFVAILAHDLRGPLATAKAAAELLSCGAVPAPRLHETARKVDRALSRADRMLRDLLDVNRIRAGARLPLSLAACNLTEVASSVIDELSVVHGSRFVLEADAEVEGRWSSDELHRAIWNLAANAVKYGDPSLPVMVDVRRRGQHAFVRVHNEGPPIPLAEQPMLFDAFTRRVADDVKRGGWGLGLTLVRGCAEAHGGSVSVESDIDHGTTFTLELPLDGARRAPAAPAPQGAGRFAVSRSSAAIAASPRARP